MSTHIDTGVKPVLKDKAQGLWNIDLYFACPVCDYEVGGFASTGSGEDDWNAHIAQFCPSCGQKIDWGNNVWNSIYDIDRWIKEKQQ